MKKGDEIKFRDNAVQLKYQPYEQFLVKANGMGFLKITIGHYCYELSFDINLQYLSTTITITVKGDFSLEMLQTVETKILEMGNTFADFHRHSFPEMYFKTT